MLSPNAFLPKELRQYQRLDERKEKLKTDIKMSLADSKNYKEFEWKMKALKYEVIKMRGIAFRDQQKVYTKGSEVGYPLATIEKILAQKQTLKIDQKPESIKPRFIDEKQPLEPLPHRPEKQTHKSSLPIADILLKPSNDFVESIDPALLEEQRRRRKKQRHRHL